MYNSQTVWTWLAHNCASRDPLAYNQNKANAKRGLACCPRDSFKQLAGNGFKFTDPGKLLNVCQYAMSNIITYKYKR